MNTGNVKLVMEVFSQDGIQPTIAMLSPNGGRVNDSYTISGHIKWKMLSLIQLAIKCNEITTNKEEKKNIKNFEYFVDKKDSFKIISCLY